MNWGRLPSVCASVLAWLDAQHDLTVGKDSRHGVNCKPKALGELGGFVMSKIRTSSGESFAE